MISPVWGFVLELRGVRTNQLNWLTHAGTRKCCGVTSNQTPLTLEVRGRDLSMTSGLETVSPTAMGQCLVWFEVVSLAIMLSVSIGLVWFKMFFLSIYYDADVCQYWSGLRWFLSIYYDADVCQYWSGLV